MNTEIVLEFLVRRCFLVNLHILYTFSTHREQKTKIVSKYVYIMMHCQINVNLVVVGDFISNKPYNNILNYD